MSGTKQIVLTDHTPVNEDFFLLVNSATDEIHQLSWSKITSIATGGASTPTSYVDAVVSGKAQKIGVLTNTDTSLSDINETVTTIEITASGFKFTNEAGEEVDVVLPTPTAMSDYTSTDAGNRLVIGTDGKLKVIDNGDSAPYLTDTFYTTNSKVEHNGAKFVAARDFRSYSTFEIDQTQGFIEQVVVEGTEIGAELGSSLAISGDGETLVTGSHLYDASGTGNDQAGRVFVWSKSVGGKWLLKQEITPNTVVGASLYGTDVTISDDGSVIAIAAPAYIPTVLSRGLVVVYRRDVSGVYSLNMSVDSFTTPHLAAQSKYGSAVSLSGDGNTLLVGSPEEDSRQGRAYVYSFDGSAWATTELFQGLTLKNDDKFGKIVKLSNNGKVAVIGSDVFDTEDSRKGVTWVFVNQDTGGWTLKTTTADKEDGYGHDISVSADGSRILVGSYSPSSTPTHNGARLIRVTGVADNTEIYESTTAEFTTSILINYEVSTGDNQGRLVRMSNDGLTWVLSADNFSKSGDTFVYGGQVVYKWGSESELKAWETNGDRSVRQTKREATLNTVPTATGDVYPLAMTVSNDANIILISSNTNTTNGVVRGGVVAERLRNLPRWVSEGSTFIKPTKSVLGANYSGAQGLVPAPPEPNMYLSSLGWKKRKAPKVTYFNVSGSDQALTVQDFNADPDAIATHFELIGGGGSMNGLTTTSNTQYAQIAGGAGGAAYASLMVNAPIPSGVTFTAKVGWSGAAKTSGEDGNNGQSTTITSIDEVGVSRTFLTAGGGLGSPHTYGSSAAIYRGAGGSDTASHNASPFFQADEYHMEKVAGQDGGVAWTHGYNVTASGINGNSYIEAGNGGDSKWGFGGISDKAISFGRNSATSVSHQAKGYGSGACGYSRARYLGTSLGYRGMNGRVKITEFF